MHNKKKTVKYPNWFNNWRKEEDLRRRAGDRQKWRVWSRTVSEENESWTSKLCRKLQEADRAKKGVVGYVHWVAVLLVHGQVTIILVVSVCLFVCLFVCAAFFSAVFDPISIKLEHVICLGLVVSPRIWGLCDPWGQGDPWEACIFRVLRLKKLSRPTVLITLSWFLVILYNAPILKLSRAIFCNFHLEPKLWRHKWRNFRFRKSCRRAMRFLPLDSSEDFMARVGLSFSLSLIVSELWHHQWRHNERCGLHPRLWTT